MKDDSLTLQSLKMFLCRGRGICLVMETRPYNYCSHYSSFILYTVLKQTHEG